jgi:hypothetical protein
MYEWIEREGRNSEGDKIHCLDYIRAEDGRHMGSVVFPNCDIGFYTCELCFDTYFSEREYMGQGPAKEFVEECTRKDEAQSKACEYNRLKAEGEKRRHEKARGLFGLFGR